jgi:hypothetical protein
MRALISRSLTCRLSSGLEVGTRSTEDKMRKTWRRLFEGAALSALCLVSAFSSAEPASATMIARMDLEEMTERAETIVDARVVSIKTTLARERRTIITTIELSEISVLKGLASEDGSRSIEMVGGTVGDESLVVAGQPEFHAGERSVLFLSPREFLLAPIVGWKQGKFNVKESATGVNVVVQESDPAKQERPCDELLETIRTILIDPAYVERSPRGPFPNLYIPTIPEEAAR